MLAKYKYYIAGGIALLVLLFLKKKKSTNSNFKTKLINLANSEYNKWNRNGIKIKEGAQDTIQDLRKYWKTGAGINQRIIIILITHGAQALLVI
jgi:hypothetical protein